MSCVPQDYMSSAEDALQKQGARCVKDMEKATAFAVESMDLGQRMKWLARLNGLLVFDHRLLQDSKTHRPWMKFKGTRKDQCRHIYVSPAFEERNALLYTILKAAIAASKWKLYVPWQ